MLHTLIANWRVEHFIVFCVNSRNASQAGTHYLFQRIVLQILEKMLYISEGVGTSAPHRRRWIPGRTLPCILQNHPTEMLQKGANRTMKKRIISILLALALLAQLLPTYVFATDSSEDLVIDAPPAW